MAPNTHSLLEKRLTRVLASLTRSAYMAHDLGEQTMADDLLMIWDEVRRVQRSIVHAEQLPPASPASCAYPRSRRS